jgi:serine/threonine protein kinase/tetratricopeptide (TPR) repeat protein
MTGELSIDRILSEALELPPPQRSAFLDQACGSDAELKMKVRDLIAALERSPEFLASPTADVLPPDDPAGSSTARPVHDSHSASEIPAGTRIGPYKLLERIGEGGFGAVYLAEQREPVQRRVALKIIKLGMDTRQVIARFEAERQALAMMDHPNIARVLDGGATDAESPWGPGRPYFVMELVKGVPITQFCDEQRLALRERLALFIDACHAVQHAHQKGVIHRDLKPSNVMVSRHDDKPVVKIIDFGIAKATGGRLTDKTLFTELRQLIGTPAYMSPEQAGLSDLDVDTRSDIYSLGVLLYELLTGTAPFEPERLRSADFDELWRIIREEEPPKPSTRVSVLRGEPRPSGRGLSEPRASASGSGDLVVEHPLPHGRGSDRSGRGSDQPSRADDSGAAGLKTPSLRPSVPSSLAADIARFRRTDLSALTRTLRGDLDWIVMKCLEKDRTRRYETANGLALEVERYLKNEPVLAGPPSRLYRLRKFVRRNRAMVTATTMVVAALLAGTAGTTFGLLRAEQRRAEAEAAREQTQQVSDFQSAMLRGINVEAMGRRIKERLREQVRAALARQYVGEFQNRRKRTAEEIEAELAAFDQRADAAQAVDVARQVMDEFVLARAADALEEQFANQPLVRAQLHLALGTTYRDLGLYAAAEPHLRAAMEIRRRELGDDHPDTLTSISYLGYVLWVQGSLAEAESCYREALEGRRRVLGDEHPATLSSINDMGELLVDRRPDEAEPYYREALEGRRRVLGDDDPDTLTSIHNIGYLLWRQGKPADAEEYYREALEGERRVLGNTSLTTVHNMGLVLRDLGRLADAERYFREVLEKSRPIWGDDNPDLLPTIHALASTLHAQGKWEDAEAYFSEALEGCRRLLGDEHGLTLRLINDMGVVLQARGKPEEAEPYFREALEKSRRVRGDDHPETLGLIHNMGFVLEAQGKPEEAEACFREALESGRRVLGVEHPGTLEWTNTMGKTLQAQGKLDEAESLFADATRVARSGLGDHPTTAMIEHHYADVLRELGRLDEALDLAQTAVDRYRAHPDWAPGEARHGRQVLTAALRAAGREAEALAVKWESVEAARQRPGMTPGALASALAGYAAEAIAIGDTASLESAEGALRECLEIREAVLPDDHQRVWLRYNAMSMLGEVLVEQATDASLAVEPRMEKLREVEPLLVESGEWLAQNADRISQQVRDERLRQALERVVKLYESWHAAEPDAGHDVRAAEWRAKLEELVPESQAEETQNDRKDAPDEPEEEPSGGRPQPSP